MTYAYCKYSYLPMAVTDIYSYLQSFIFANSSANKKIAIFANEICMYMQVFIIANSNANKKIAIFVNERCRYMQLFIFANSNANMHGPMQVWKPRAYLLPLSKGTPAQRIRKTAFLKHPRRFGLQVSINIPVSKFFSPIYICVHLRRVLMPSYICISCVFAPVF